MHQHIRGKRDQALQASASSATRRFLHTLLQRETGTILSQSIPLQELKRVLDIFCGPGMWAIDLARAYPALQVTGIDTDLALLRQFRADARVASITNLRVEHVPDLRWLPYVDEYFDCLHIWGSGQKLTAENWLQVLHACQRVLRPGGWLHLESFLMGPGSSPALSQLLDLLREAPPAPAPDLILRFPALLAQVGFIHIHHKLLPLDLGNQNGSVGRDYITTVLLKDPRIFYLLENRGREQIVGLLDLLLLESASLDYCALGTMFSITANKAKDATDDQGTS
jgi:SAM-dependent methyltransferase